MSNSKFSPVYSFDRFGWFWQPEKWLKNMSAADARQATVKSTGTAEQKSALQEAVSKSKKEAKSRASEMKSELGPFMQKQ